MIDIGARFGATYPSLRYALTADALPEIALVPGEVIATGTAPPPGSIRRTG